MMRMPMFFKMQRPLCATLVLCFALALAFEAQATVLIVRTLLPGNILYAATVSVELADACPASTLTHELGANDLAIGYANFPGVTGLTVGANFPGVSEQKDICIDGAPDKIVITPLEGSSLAAGNLCASPPTPRTAVRKGAGQLVLNNCMTSYRVYGQGYSCTDPNSCLGTNNSHVYAGGVVLRLPDDYIFSAFGQWFDSAMSEYNLASYTICSGGGCYNPVESRYTYFNAAAFGTARSGQAFPPVSDGAFYNNFCPSGWNCSFPGLPAGAVAKGDTGGSFPLVVTGAGCTAAQRDVMMPLAQTYGQPAGGCAMIANRNFSTSNSTIIMAPGYSYILGY